MNKNFKNRTSFGLNNFQQSLTRRTVIAMLGGWAVLAQAQPTGQLYDPEPPVDSGYVRVLSLVDTPRMSVMIDGKARIPALSKQQPSEYMVVPAGRHQLEIFSATKLMASIALDVVQGTSVTVVLPAATTAPLVFIDKTSTNKLKSMLTVYQLFSKNEALDLLTVDGSTKIFKGLAYGRSGAIQVNPISVELMAVVSGTNTSLARAALNMTQGGAYSIFLISAPNNKATAMVAENKIERYTGK
jgi:hypothetical protein